MKKLFMALVAFFACGTGCTHNGGYTTQDNGDFAKIIAQDSVQLIDVRTPSEYATGHISSAVNLDVNGSDFEHRAAQFDPSRPVAVYCRSGMRSRKAAQWFASRGFVVYNLRSGILGWPSPLTM